MKTLFVILALSLFIQEGHCRHTSSLLNGTIEVQFAYLHQAKQMNFEKAQQDNGAMSNGIDEMLLHTNPDNVEIETPSGRDHAVVVMLTMEILISLLIFIRLGFDYLKKH